MTSVVPGTATAATGAVPPSTPATAADRVANLDINDYARSMYGVPFSEATASQKSDIAAAMRADQRAATNGAVPADSEAATAMRLATRALRAADRESVRDRDDYALATYGVVFNALTPVQMEDVANYMRNDEKRAFGTVLPGGEAADAKRQADANYAAMPAGSMTGMTTGTTAGTTVAAGAAVPPVGYDTTGAPVCPPGTVPTGSTRAI